VERRADRLSDPDLFDPAVGPSLGWPKGCESDRVYLEAFARGGSTTFISNLRTKVMGVRSDARVFPVTINEAEYGDAYVCLPHTAYALYAKDELRILKAGSWTPVLGLFASGAGALLRAARINRIVHLNNYMLSTNLHAGWRGEDADVIRDLLAERLPDHFIAVRSINAWSDAELLARMRDDGWVMLPSRQIYVTDDLATEWASRRDTRRDTGLMEANADRVDRLQVLKPGDAERIAELYAMLYLDRYSQLNPAFTAAYIEMTHRTGFLQYRGLREADGALSAVVGCFVRGGVLTTPIVGYDVDRPAEEGLYRMASVLYAQMAMERGLRLNGSAGAAGFKRNRGARPVIEYTAMWTKHLSPFRRGVVGAMAAALNGIAAPMLAERGL
jgi:hypothetical protein